MALFKDLLGKAKAQSALGDPIMRRYNAEAKNAENESYRSAIRNLSTQTGNELAGTPGFLASQSTPAGSLQRNRSRMLSRSLGNLTTGFGGIAAERAGAGRDFYGRVLGMREEKRLNEPKKTAGWKKALGRIAGTGLGLLTGGPGGVAAGFLGSGTGGANQYEAPGSSYWGPTMGF